MTSSKLNLHLYPTPMTHESRILKETQAIRSFGAFSRVVLVGTRSVGLPDVEMLDGSREIARLSRPAPRWLPSPFAKAVGIAGWSAQVLRRFARQQVGCINCHSLSVLPVGLAIKHRTGARLIYDPHELETEANGLGRVRRVAAKFVERALYPAADAVIVVGDDIADWYQGTYGGARPAVVLNCPPRCVVPRTTRLRDALGISPDSIIFLYQGVLGAGRGIELMLDAFQAIDDPRKVLVLMGMGPLEPFVAARTRNSASIRLHPAVPPQQLLAITASADVGLCLIEDTCLSYRLCVPNKLFEYLAAGIPPVVSNLPELARVVSRYQAGWVLPSWSSTELRSLVDAIDVEGQGTFGAAVSSGRPMSTHGSPRCPSFKVCMNDSVSPQLGRTQAGLIPDRALRLWYDSPHATVATRLGTQGLYQMTSTAPLQQVRSCTRCIMNSQVEPTIQLDADGVCNHCRRYNSLVADRVMHGPEGRLVLDGLISRMKDAGRGREYDCIVGVSGGVDSTYVAYLVRKLGLRPLAVHFDNGWNSEAGRQQHRERAEAAGHRSATPTWWTGRSSGTSRSRS